jgi:hypothetical protein
MSQELEPGCLAVIIESVDGAAVGQTVSCVRVMGEHTLYGTIWRVRSNSTLVTEHGGVGNEADCPAKWLKKILPGDDVKTKEREKINAE